MILVIAFTAMKFLRANGLSLTLFGLFAVSLAGQFVAGWQEYNEDQAIHRQPQVTAAGYLGEGHFWEALFENWESEFLQMAAYIVLTIFLFQKGAVDSKRIDVVERVDRILPKRLRSRDVPWPVNKGGLVLRLYQNSLSIALLLLFVLSFSLHAVAGASAYNSEQLEHGRSTVTTLEYMATSKFWFESFQNWQSEFLSIGVLTVLSVFLRQKGSPESKPVDTPHSETGGE